jgi:hypothetical protein
MRQDAPHVLDLAATQRHEFSQVGVEPALDIRLVHGGIIPRTNAGGLCANYLRCARAANKTVSP